MAENRSSNVIVLPHRRRQRLRVAALRWSPRHDTRGSESPPASTISDYDLHAFVDNVLDGARRTRVQAFLAQHPAAAADAAAYFQQNRMLRALRRPSAPISPALSYLAAHFAFRLVQARIGRATIWSTVAAVFGAGAWLLVSGDWVVVPHLILATGR